MPTDPRPDINALLADNTAAAISAADMRAAFEAALVYVEESAGGGGGSVTLTAASTIAAGDKIALRSDGQIEPVTGTGMGSTVSALQTYYSGVGTTLCMAFDTILNKVLIIYKDGNNSNYLTSVVGTISAGTMTFGTPTVVIAFEVTYPTMVFDPNVGKFLLMYERVPNYGFASVGTISGTSISWGTEVAIVASTGFKYGSQGSTCYDPITQKCVTVFATDGSDVKGIVATISGTTVTFGATYTFASSGVPSDAGIKIGYDPKAQKMIAAWWTSTNTLARVVTISGTSLVHHVGQFNQTITNGAGIISGGFIANPVTGELGLHIRMVSGPLYERVFLTLTAQPDGYGDFYPTVTKQVKIHDRYNEYRDFSYNPIYETWQAMYVWGTGFWGVTEVMMDPHEPGNDITQGRTIQTIARASGIPIAVVDPVSGAYLVSTFNQAHSAFGDVVLFTPRTLTNGYAFIGIAPSAITAAAAGDVSLAGTTVAGQTGLVTGKKYYLKYDGTLSIVPTGLPLVGTALSATEILLK